MKVKNLVLAGTFSLMTLIGACSTMYQIDEKEQAVVIQMGKPKRIILGSNVAGEVDTGLVRKISEWNSSQPENKRADEVTAGAGIYFKLPFIQSVEKWDDRLLDYSSAPTDVVTKDKKHVLMDTYAKWRIVNPLLFRQTAISINGAQAILDDNIYSVVRELAGRSNLIELVRSTNSLLTNSEGEQVDSITVGKEKIMEDITYKSNEKMQPFGIEVVDVRMRKTDLPQDNMNSVYTRMQSERARIAKQYRSEGEEEATKIRASADKERTQILSEGFKTAEEIKGEGNGEETRIYNVTYSRNPKFFKLWNTLETYPTTFQKGDRTKVVLNFDSEYLQYLKGPSNK